MSSCSYSSSSSFRYETPRTRSLPLDLLHNVLSRLPTIWLLKPRAEWSVDPTDTDLGHAYAFDLWWIKHLKADSIISLIPGGTIFHVAGNANSLSLNLLL
ncbi:hypothetical protein NL676_039773 [Syzygium grande]|nr:hypothetical protein NL676_039773 [Syzygium grande]